MSKAEQISSATSKNPYLLFDNFFTYENKVFEIDKANKLHIEIPDADPLTFRKEGIVFADKKYVFTKRPRNSSDFNFTNKNIVFRILNIFWEYVALEEVDGNSFSYFKENQQIKYCKDYNNVYIESRHLGYPSLKKIETADVNTFECLDFSYAKDKNHVFYKDKVININPEECRTNINRFIWDSENIYHYDAKLPLDANSFEVLSYESEINPYLGKIILRDKDGQYVFSRSWQSKNIILKKNNQLVTLDN